MVSTLAVTRAVSLAAVIGLALAACGSSADSSSASQPAAAATSGAAEESAPSSADPGAADPSADILGDPDPASGEPLKFGILNIEAGPVTFPESRLAAEAAVEYVNEYRGGIGGRPIELIDCPTDGQPATSERCANQILDQDPIAVIGGADTGAAGAFTVWERANIAHIGGVPFTPFDYTSPISVKFATVSLGDNAALAVYAAQELGVKKVSVMYTDDSTGDRIANQVLKPTFEALGVTEVQVIPIPPTAPDVSAQAAAAASTNPDLVYIVSPNACVNVMLALQTVGYTGEKMGIATCAIPPALEAAGAAADGLYTASPNDPLFGPSPDAQLFQAVMDKYAPEGTVRSDPAALPFASVMNLEAALDDIPAEDLTTENILAAFKDGSEVPNFLAHPYTCDGTALANLPALCNAYQRINQVKDGRVGPVGDEWVTPGEFYKG